MDCLAIAKQLDSSLDVNAAIRLGFSVSEYHRVPLNEEATIYSVLVSAPDCLDMVCTASLESLTKAMNCATEVLERSIEKPHLTFQKAVEAGYRVLAFTKHKEKDLYSVWMASDNTMKVFGNVSKEHLMEVAGDTLTQNGRFHEY